MPIEDVALAGGIALIGVLEGVQLSHTLGMEGRIARIEAHLGIDPEVRSKGAKRG